jgi:hypothetical protein
MLNNMLWAQGSNMLNNMLWDMAKAVQLLHD